METEALQLLKATLAREAKIKQLRDSNEKLNGNEISELRSK
jgi:hypothetical protein